LHLNIPISLIIFAIQKRKIQQLRLYIYLKSRSSGYINWDKNTINQIKKDLQIKDTRTINRQLRWLLKNKWVHMNSKKQCLRVAGYLMLFKKYNFQSATGALFNTNHFNKFRAFLYASIISHYSKYKSRLAYQSGRKKGRSISNCSFVDLPASYLAKVLGIGRSSIVRYRKEAWDAGFIKMKHRHQKHPLKIEELSFFRYCFRDEVNDKIAFKSEVYKQLSNTIKTNIHLRTKRRKSPRKNWTRYKKGSEEGKIEEPLGDDINPLHS